MCEISWFRVGKTEDREAGEKGENPLWEKFPDENHAKGDVEQPEFFGRIGAILKKGIEHGDEREGAGVQHFGRVEQNRCV